MKNIISSSLGSLVGTSTITLVVASIYSFFVDGTLTMGIPLRELLFFSITFGMLATAIVSPLILYRKRKGLLITDEPNYNSRFLIILIPILVYAGFMELGVVLACGFGDGVACISGIMFAPVIFGSFIVSLFLPKKIQTYSLLLKFNSLLASVIWILSLFIESSYY